MKIVYDNIIYSLQKAGGISIYWTELIKRLIQKKDNILFFEFFNNNIFKKYIDIKTQEEFRLNLKILRYLPFLKKIPVKSIFHSSYYRVSLQKNIVNITTVHDFTYEYFGNGLAKYIHMWQKGFAIKRSDGIICVSENTKKDLKKFYPKIDESKIEVIYNGVSNQFLTIEDPEKYLIGDFKILNNIKFILYVGDRSSYKNFDISIRILEELDDYSLVIVGGKELDNSEKEYIKNIKDRVYHFRGIGGVELNILYNNAFCLLYPSSYEGFGIPICEAMKASCPVISTSISSIPEVAGDAALLVSDIKKEYFIKEVKKLENKEFRNELIIKGLKQVEKFSWDKCFDETYKFYVKVYRKKFL